jgi:hypothetical protein
MDPNAALEAIRDLQAQWREKQYIDGAEDAALNILEKMSGHVAALDEWLTRGGFLPEAWKAAR